MPRGCRFSTGLGGRWHRRYGKQVDDARLDQLFERAPVALAHGAQPQCLGEVGHRPSVDADSDGFVADIGFDRDPTVGLRVFSFRGEIGVRSRNKALEAKMRTYASP